MVDVEPLLETPFEETPNRTFGALLLARVVLLEVVAVLDRSPLTMAIVGLYLLAVPGYVAVRVQAGGTGIEHRAKSVRSRRRP
ncbi:hypothetical protein CV102_23550 [Natronococcus pandeyae]|uniref:Uncharacterized protein n=1 Tax=Natronococcus pandeyae TaxID=2055836 RepID=A0A8J8PXH1_9EURY|nr:hypothetical protein [Natronococcus pandeyae]TYL36260.1 hypothetical protein CV102_23550 [Natronococcus pandeyae]